ncbi:MAG: peptidase M48 Ste24p, partial [Cyanobacteria bacterium SW_10_48_33]
GLYALNASKYSVDGIYNLMATMRQENASSRPEWASSHPVPESLLHYVQELIQRRGYERHSYYGVVPYAQMKQTL